MLWPKWGKIYPRSFILKPKPQDRLAGSTSCEQGRQMIFFFPWRECKPCTKWDDFGIQEFYRNHCSMALSIFILQREVILSGWWMARQSASGSWSTLWRDHELVNRDQIRGCLCGSTRTLPHCWTFTALPICVGQREKKLHMFLLILNIGWFRTEVELHTVGAGGVKRAFVD